jgi:hypothetical protein
MSPAFCIVTADATWSAAGALGTSLKVLQPASPNSARTDRARPTRDAERLAENGQWWSDGLIQGLWVIDRGNPLPPRHHPHLRGPPHFVNRSGFLQADQRSKHRKQTFKFGIITCGANRRILSVVKNISMTGALIEVDNALEIPDEFTLTIESESAVRACRVAWKKANQCRIIDVSIAGVRIRLPFAGKLPETFTLLLSKHGQGHRVRTMWRRANQIGAKFI